MQRFIFVLIFLLASASFCYSNDTTILYEEYEAAVSIANEQDKPILLIFSADWCGYCNKLKTEILVDNTTSDYVVCVLNTDNNKAISKKFRTRSLPTSVIIRKGEESTRKVGYKGKDDYISWLINK
jgi:thioredoxin 1